MHAIKKYGMQFGNKHFKEIPLYKENRESCLNLGNPLDFKMFVKEF
jgi:hypothetical protein